MEIRSAISNIRRDLHNYDPFLGPTTLALSLYFVQLGRDMISYALAVAGSDPFRLAADVMAMAMLPFLLTPFATAIVAMIANYGAERWESTAFCFEEGGKPMWAEEEGREKLKVVQVTYLRAFRWTLEGLASIAWVILWRMWLPVGRTLRGAFVTA
jgi:hypothetical protein